MTGADFAEWRRLMRINKAAAARELGIGRASIWSFEKEPDKEVPKYIALACTGLWVRLGPWRSELTRMVPFGSWGSAGDAS